MNTIEWFVLIFVLLAAIKLLFVIFSPKSWMNMAKGLYKNPTLLFLVELILALILFSYLIKSFSIVTIMAGVLLGALLTGLTFSAYAKDLMPIFTKAFSKDILKRAWVSVLIWIILIVWTLTVLF